MRVWRRILVVALGLPVLAGTFPGVCLMAGDVPNETKDAKLSLLSQPLELVWNKELEVAEVPANAPTAEVTFHYRNPGSQKISIVRVDISCGCTTASLPPLPFDVAPGTSGDIPVRMNIAGKYGTVTKSLTVVTDSGQSKLLLARAVISEQADPAATPVTSQAAPAPASPEVASAAPAVPAVATALIPPPPQPVVFVPPPQITFPKPRMLNPNRGQNFQMAAKNRQEVFSGDCRRCHVEMGKDKLGKELYDADCGICHDSPNRATMVTDLRSLTGVTGADFWRTWIRHGKPGSLMPAFAESEGGPLSEAEIESLVDYLLTVVPVSAEEFE